MPVQNGFAQQCPTDDRPQRRLNELWEAGASREEWSEALRKDGFDGPITLSQPARHEESPDAADDARGS